MGVAMMAGCSGKYSHHVEWQQPFFIDDTTVGLVGWDYYMGSARWNDNSEFKDLRQLLYKYIIPQKSLVLIKELRNPTIQAVWAG